MYIYVYTYIYIVYIYTYTYIWFGLVCMVGCRADKTHGVNEQFSYKETKRKQGSFHNHKAEAVNVNAQVLIEHCSELSTHSTFHYKYPITHTYSRRALFCV